MEDTMLQLVTVISTLVIGIILAIIKKVVDASIKYLEGKKTNNKLVDSSKDDVLKVVKKICDDVEKDYEIGETIDKNNEEEELKDLKDDNVTKDKKVALENKSSKLKN